MKIQRNFQDMKEAHLSQQKKKDAQKQLLALRSALKTGDFIRVKQPGTDKVLFVPRLHPSEENSGPHWCMALCGDNPQQFAVVSIGPDGQLVPGPNCIVELAGPNGPLEVTVDSLDDGGFEVKYDEGNLSSGVFTSEMVVDGQSIGDSPIELQVGNIADTQKCSVKGPNLEEIVIYSRDMNGNPVDGICTVVMKGPDGEPVEVKVEDVGDGSFVGKYDQLEPGDYVIDCMVDSQPVAKFRVKSSRSDEKGDDLSYDVVYSSGSGLYASGIDENPIGFSGYEGSPPITAKKKDAQKQLLALRSALLTGDFIRVKQPGTDRVLFVPRLHPSGENSGPHWCMAICEDNPQQFAVVSIGSDGQPVQGPNCIVEIAGPNGPLEVTVDSLDDGGFEVKY